MSRPQGKHRVGSARGRRIVRVVAVVLVCGGAALALSAFGPDYLDRSPARADQRFVAAVHSRGHTIAPGEDQTLVVQAAHKVCDSERTSASSAQRRAGALTTEEIDAVRRTFGDDSPAFIAAAERSYCP